MFDSFYTTVSHKTLELQSALRSVLFYFILYVQSTPLLDLITQYSVLVAHVKLLVPVKLLRTKIKTHEGIKEILTPDGYVTHTFSQI